MKRQSVDMQSTVGDPGESSVDTHHSPRPGVACRRHSGTGAQGTWRRTWSRCRVTSVELDSPTSEGVIGYGIEANRILSYI